MNATVEFAVALDGQWNVGTVNTETLCCTEVPLQYWMPIRNMLSGTQHVGTLMKISLCEIIIRQTTKYFVFSLLVRCRTHMVSVDFNKAFDNVYSSNQFHITVRGYPHHQARVIWYILLPLLKKLYVFVFL